MVNDLIFKAPEEEGVPSGGILKFTERLAERKTNLHSFMIVRNGNIITEAYYKPFDKDFMHRLYSVSKTYVSVAVGMLIGEGKIKLSDRLSDLLPELAEGAENDKWLKECTVEDALKMSVPMFTDTYCMRDYKDWAWTFFNHPTRSRGIKPAGTVFNYNTSGTFILDVLVERLTGKPFLEYMRPVFDKIGVSDKIWCVKSPDGYSWGGSGVICTLRDFAKFAELLLCRGEYKGEQLLPKDYMLRAESKQISNLYSNHYTIRHTMGYGYQIWMTKYGFAMYGMGSQYAFCFPDENLLFVCTGDTQSDTDTEGDYIFENFVHEVYERVSDAPLPVGEDYNKLKSAVENLELHTGYGAAHKPFEKVIDGVTYDLKENPMGWKWLRLDFDKDGSGGALSYENRRGIKRLRFGCDRLLADKFPETCFYDRQVDLPSGREMPCLTDLTWQGEREILIRTYIVDSVLGNCFMNFGFRGEGGEEIGVSMHKRAEFFMEDYAGFAGGARRG